MKLRHPLLIKAAGLAGAWALRGWVGTLRYHYCPLGRNVDPRTRHVRGRRYIYAFWHENMLLPAYQFGRLNIHVLISEHADGRLIAEVIRRLGFGVVTGSTTRQGARALRQMITMPGDFHFGITPDGPRGPRRRVQIGLVALSSHLGLPIVPAGFGYDRPRRLRSWDRFALPRPFTRATCVTAEPVLVPPGAARHLLEAYRQRVESRLTEVSAAAERWAEDGIPPARAADDAPPARRRLAG